MAWEWSSLPAYQRGRGPDWLVRSRVLSAFELAKDGRGRRAYVEWLERRARNEEGEIDEEATKALRRGWYLGEPSFADKLRSLVVEREERPVGSDRVARSHDETGAEDLAKRALLALKLPFDSAGLLALPKGHEGKVLVAVLLRERTPVGNRWISQRLSMGHVGSVSRLIGTFRRAKREMKKVRDLEKMLRCGT